MFAILRAVVLIFATVVAVLIVIDGTLLANLLRRSD
jgi:hypothetical protein